MLIYLVVIAITAFFASRIYVEYNSSGVKTYPNRRSVYGWLFLILIIWVAVFAIKNPNDTDASLYKFTYERFYKEGVTFQKALDNYRDKLYAVLAYICTNISKGDWVFGASAIGVLIYTPILYLISKKSEDITISCLLYFFTMNWYYGTNGMRQALAGSFAICAYYFGLREKKYFKYILLILIAYGFHASVLLLIPFHILSMKKLKSVSTWLFFFAFISLSFFLKDVWGGFSEVFSSNVIINQYQDVLQNSMSHGSSILRVLVVIAPLILIGNNYSKIKTDYEGVDHDVIMISCGAIFMVYSMLDVNFSQMSFYFSSVLLILIPKVINAYEIEKRQTMKTIIMVLYFAYMVILLFNGDMGAYPYRAYWQTGTVS